MNKICQQIKDLIKDNLSEILELRSTGRLKNDNTFVSEGDLLSERLIAEFIKREYPEALLITEESYRDVSTIAKAQLIITVDPIDGTENFVSGMKEWGIGVSIYDKSLTHIQSMIYLPELDECLITGDSLVRRSGSRICGLPSYMKTEHFLKLSGEFEYRIMGCCMYNMYNVITGVFAKFCHLTGCYSWDILPGLNLALEHGLDVTVNGEQYKGEFLYPGNKYRLEVCGK